MTRYEAVYNDALALIAKENVHVIHCALPPNTNGYFCCRPKHIAIRKTLKYKKEGLIALFHEYGHYMDFKAKKYKNFFSQKSLGKFDKKKMLEIERAEKSAGRWAQKMLKKYGIEYEAEELDPEQLKSLRKGWRIYYFDREK